ncbi:MAG: aldolase/citrate lyase family protein [Chitinophagaceae bacterium]|nr:aldolase/citrate lyase family protein [Chitinophagaceae bacterium]
MKNIDQFKAKHLQFGTWISSGSPVVAELASYFSIDWLLFDFEHGNAGEAQVLEMLRAVASQPVTVIVRVAALDPAIISRILDWGADGIMLPHVRSADEALRCVSAMRYPPHGTRGYSSSVRAYRYGTDVPAEAVKIKPLFFAQIEDMAGVQNSREIAAVDGVDVLFVGPSDLRLDLEHNPAARIVSFESAIQQVADAANTHHKRAGILLRDYSALKRMQALGFSSVAIDSDIGILRAGYKKIAEHVAAIRQSTGE